MQINMQLSDDKKQLENKIEEFKKAIINLNNNNNVENEKHVSNH